MSAPSEPETLADLFTREARSERPALVDPSGREYDAHWLRTSAWKAGNFLRHTGVRRGVTVGVVGDGPIALLGAFGTALLEGRVWLDPPTALADAEDVRTLVAPLDDLEDYDLPPGGQQVGYGGKPTDPSVHHFDAGLWSENPSFPPVEFDPETPLLTDGSRTIDHRTILDAGAAFVDRIDLEAGDRVSIEAPLDDPRTIVLGVVAPLLADAVIELPTSDSPSTDGRGPGVVVTKPSSVGKDETAGADSTTEVTRADGPRNTSSDGSRYPLECLPLGDVDSPFLDVE